MLDLTNPETFGTGRNNISNLLSIAESVYFLKIENYETIAKKWFEKTTIVPLSDRETSLEQSPKIN